MRRGTASEPVIHSLVVPLRIADSTPRSSDYATDPISRPPVPHPVTRAGTVRFNLKPHGTSMFRYFENLVPPYPDAAPPVLPRGFFAFLWACARGARRYIAAVDRAAWAPLAVGGGACRQRRAGRSAKPPQTTGACRQFRHAVAMGFPSQHARAKL